MIVASGPTVWLTTIMAVAVAPITEEILFRGLLQGALVGVFGLISLPNQWLVLFIYSITLFYALLWLLNIKLHSNRTWLDRFFLLLGGYVAGISLSGAPLMIAVFMRNIAAHQLRNTMFVLWIILVSLKLSTLAALGFSLYAIDALLLIPVAAIGHLLGLRVHPEGLDFRPCLPSGWGTVNGRVRYAGESLEVRVDRRGDTYAVRVDGQPAPAGRYRPWKTDEGHTRETAKPETTRNE